MLKSTLNFLRRASNLVPRFILGFFRECYTKMFTLNRHFAPNGEYDLHQTATYLPESLLENHDRGHIFR